MKNTHIHLIALLLLAGTLNASEEKAPSQVIVLENEVLHIVDGNALGINGTTIGMMLHLRSEVS